MLDPTELEATARASLPEPVASYFAGPPALPGVPTDAERWAQWRIRPHVLRDTTGLDLTTTVLGTPVASPVLVAPMAQQVAAHPDGERATAKAAAAVGTLLGVSTNTGVPFADIAAAGAPWWFQVYVMPNRSVTEELVRAAVEHGAKALILTVDLPVVDPRRPDTEPRTWENRYNMLANLAPGRIDELGIGTLRGARDLTPEVIGWLKEISGGLPVIAKGVLRGDDAADILAAGADALIVSTHGGRRLIQSISAADALVEVVDAAGDAEVYVDSGLRTAEHVAAALCLGARAVLVGRPVMWALAAGGEQTVTDLLTAWTREVGVVLQQLGVTSPSRLTRDLVVHSGR